MSLQELNSELRSIYSFFPRSLEEASPIVVDEVTDPWELLESTFEGLGNLAGEEIEALMDEVDEEMTRNGFE